MSDEVKIGHTITVPDAAAATAKADLAAALPKRATISAVSKGGNTTLTVVSIKEKS
jgi:hypothetical protein